jgi:hypothetical protein
MREFLRHCWKTLGGIVLLACGAVLLYAEDEDPIPCYQGCHMSQCWVVDGVCWKAPQYTCCDIGWASAVGGTRTSYGANLTADRWTGCVGECSETTITDERAACGATQFIPAETWSIFNCRCD